MTIGEVARIAGLEASAIRYYESMGLLPVAPRFGGRRQYDERALHWLALIGLARSAGFSIAEVRQLVAGFERDTMPGVRWRSLAKRKLAELDAIIARTEAMRDVLRKAVRCRCPTLEMCGQAAAACRP